MPAARAHHHAYEGGLAAHTLEVTNYAAGIANVVANVDMDVLMTAALWHDFHKISEYSDDSADAGYRDTIGHICGSAIEFRHWSHAHGVDRVTFRKVAHCILAHHGPVREWGSPVAPQTIEAMILHQADMLSANFGATK